MGWLSGWSRRQEITIDNTNIDSDLGDFPVLIHLSASCGPGNQDVTHIFDHLGASSLKIAVTTSNGETQCYVEIELWDNANEQAWLWVKVPTVTAASTTTLYLYYDSSQGDNTTYVGAIASAPGQAVWDSYFETVHHHVDYDTSNVKDSTSNHDGTKASANNPAETSSGKIGPAQDYDGIDDFIQIGTDLFETDNVGAIEAWIYIADAANDEFYILTSSYADGGDFLAFQYNNSYNIFIQYYISGVASDLVGTDNPPGTGWIHTVVTTNGSAWTIYVNGVPVAITAVAGSNSGSWFDDLGAHTHQTIMGGMKYSHLTYYGDGPMDEIRVHSDDRSAAWWKASFYSGDDNLLTFGAIQLNFLDGVKSADSLVKSPTKNLSDGSQTADSIVKTVTKNLSDGAVGADSIVKNPTKNLTEGSIGADAIVKGVTKNLTEGSVLADAIAKTVAKALTDGAVLADAIIKNPIKNLTEGVVLADSIVKSVTKILTDGAELSDNIAKSLIRTFNDGVKIADSIGRNVFIGLSDGVKVTVSSLVATMRWKSIGNTWSGTVKWIRNLLTWVGWSKTPESSITWTKKTKNTQTWTKKDKREC